MSTWLNAGVPPTKVAEWAGHSVEVLLTIYAKCLDGEGARVRSRVADALEWRPCDDVGGRSRVAPETSAPIRRDRPSVMAGHGRTDSEGSLTRFALVREPSTVVSLWCPQRESLQNSTGPTSGFACGRLVIEGSFTVSFSGSEW